MKISSCLIIFLFVIGSIKAQQVVASSGDYFSKNTISVTYTLGEVVADTYTKSPFVLTQGFNQPGYSISNASEIISNNYDFQIYPNPVVEKITFSRKVNKDNSMVYEVYGINGILVTEGAIVGTNTEISFKNYPKSIYILKIYSKNKEIESYKIVKQ